MLPQHREGVRLARCPSGGRPRRSRRRSSSTTGTPSTMSPISVATLRSRMTTVIDARIERVEPPRSTCCCRRAYAGGAAARRSRATSASESAIVRVNAVRVGEVGEVVLPAPWTRRGRAARSSSPSSAARRRRTCCRGSRRPAAQQAVARPSGGARARRRRCGWLDTIVRPLSFSYQRKAGMSSLLAEQQARLAGAGLRGEVALPAARAGGCPRASQRAIVGACPLAHRAPQHGLARGRRSRT